MHPWELDVSILRGSDEASLSKQLNVEPSNTQTLLFGYILCWVASSLLFSLSIACSVQMHST